MIVYCIYCVLRYVLQANDITRDQIYAGMCVYLMLGFAFGCIYYLLEILMPGCFSVNVAKLAGDPPDLMYFSFVTLATLGMVTLLLQQSFLALWPKWRHLPACFTSLFLWHDWFHGRHWASERCRNRTVEQHTA